MANYQKNVTKRIVSSGGKIIAKAKIVVEIYGDGQNETSQNVSVNISSSNYAKTISRSSRKSNSISCSESSSCDHYKSQKYVCGYTNSVRSRVIKTEE